MSHSVITNVGDGGDPAHESLVVKALARAGRATPPGRSIKRTLQLRYATLAGSGTRGSVVAEPVQRWRRPLFTRKTSRSEEHTSELQSHLNLVCRLLLEKKKIHDIKYKSKLVQSS